jgi:hypothetical protein
VIAPGARIHRLALRLAPRSHRDRFGAEQAQLYDDLIRQGTPGWRLWLGLPRDLLAVRNGSRRPSPVAQVAGGPALVLARVRRPARALVTVLSAALHLAWLAGHLMAGAAWRVTTVRAIELFGHAPTWGDWVRYLNTDPELERRAATTAAIVPWLVLSFPIVTLCWFWLPHRRWFVALWVVAWPVGMVLLRGYGTFVTS